MRAVLQARPPHPEAPGGGEGLPPQLLQVAAALSASEPPRECGSDGELTLTQTLPRHGTRNQHQQGGGFISVCMFTSSAAVF